MPYLRGVYLTDEEFHELGLDVEYDYDARFTKDEIQKVKDSLLEQFKYYSGEETLDVNKTYNSRGSAAFLALCLLDHELLLKAKEMPHWSPDLVVAYRHFGSKPKLVVPSPSGNLEFDKFKIKLANHIRDGLTLQFIWKNPETLNMWWDEFTITQILKQASWELR